MEKVKDIIDEMVKKGYPDKEYWKDLSYIHNDNYLARKGELHTTNEEKTYVTRKPLWWLSEDGRNVKQRI